MSASSAPQALARPPYDPELDTLLANSPLPTAITPEMIEPLRAAPFTAPIEEVLSTRNLNHTVVTVPGPDGDLTASVFTPRRKSAPGAGIYFLHGGGMVIGDRFTGIENILDAAEEHHAVVVSLDYRLAPEHPDPAPVEDAYAGFVWTAAHAADLGIDPDRLLLAGTSAGGGLAAGVALLARDRQGPAAMAQLLMSPMLDDRDETVSSRQYSGSGSWSRESNDTGWNALLGERRRSKAVSVYAAPARATDLSELPPAFIDVGSAEVFRDEDVAYASRLWASGVQAELHVWAGGFHIFDGAAPHAALSVAALQARTAWVRRTLGDRS
ncbi:alpha/beta hydrolase [Microbispora bryophytorum]|uniref:Alpha/beta hydrolase n=1 Tax=Microbispora bryophytorum subsp. camponoti TaxID=1677852 RepID=A0ABR8L0L4_9ACTN|nr:alpha/beta hydrolase fold domain-containing protein [Microbispora camponoti]MBD3142014.1 alpha/beta hydrolase [Microbispora camponoti]